MSIEATAAALDPAEGMTAHAAAAAGDPGRTTWALTRAALREDRAHWHRRIGAGGGPLVLRRGYQAVALYRLSRCAHECGFKAAGWLLWILNTWLTGADIPPSSRIAGGLFLPFPYGVVIAGAVGRNAAFGFQASMGGLFKEPDRDVGGGPGLPRLGDDVVLEPAAVVLGAVVIGDRSLICARCLATRDMAPDSRLEGEPWRIVQRKGAAS